MPSSTHQPRSSPERDVKTPVSFRRARMIRRGAVALAAVILLLVVVQIVASAVVTAVVNRTLAGMEEYTGRVDAIRLVLWKGGGDPRGHPGRGTHPLSPARPRGASHL
jgi:hypothetical protein